MRSRRIGIWKRTAFFSGRVPELANEVEHVRHSQDVRGFAKLYIEPSTRSVHKRICQAKENRPEAVVQQGRSPSLLLQVTPPCPRTLTPTILGG
jgi:hypothetical protein